MVIWKYFRFNTKLNAKSWSILLEFRLFWCNFTKPTRYTCWGMTLWKEFGNLLSH